MRVGLKSSAFSSGREDEVVPCMMIYGLVTRNHPEVLREWFQIYSGGRYGKPEIMIKDVWGTTLDLRSDYLLLPRIN